MNFIDTHSHLFLEEFSADLPQVIARAKSAGIGKILMPNIDSSTIKPMLEVANSYKGYCYPMIGLHPTSVKENYEDELQVVLDYLTHTGMFVAVGEVGIDLYWDKTYKKEQMIAFDKQIQWAIQYDLPLVIHSRDSFKEIVEVLSPYRNEPVKGIFHSFGGNREEAEQLLSFDNFYLGINGVVTFKNSLLSDVLKSISITKIVLETDSPYLTPVPFRGKRNESAYIKYVLAKIAEIYGMSLDEAAKITTKNVLKIFKITE